MLKLRIPVNSDVQNRIVFCSTAMLWAAYWFLSISHCDIFQAGSFIAKLQQRHNINFARGRFHQRFSRAFFVRIFDFASNCFFYGTANFFCNKCWWNWSIESSNTNVNFLVSPINDVICVIKICYIKLQNIQWKWLF